MKLLSCPSHIWIDSLFAMSAMDKCSLLVSVSLRLFAVVNARWTTSNRKLSVLEPQSIKSTERAKRLLIAPVYSLRGIRAYDELQKVVTEVGQVRQAVTRHWFSTPHHLTQYGFTSPALSGIYSDIYSPSLNINSYAINNINIYKLSYLNSTMVTYLPDEIPLDLPVRGRYLHTDCR